ncbi:MAG: GNAT family N-acetyltransferase [bacterium]|nr:GNAT family N-acetyltransferase [bacterium]
MVLIRPATEADFPTIKRLLRIGELPLFDVKWQHFLVADIEGEIVGVGQIRQHSQTRELGSLVVLPEYRNQGVASRLIDALEAKAGFPLYLFCQENMQPYYARFGYQTVQDARTIPGSMRLKARLLILARRFGISALVMRKG